MTETPQVQPTDALLRALHEAPAPVPLSFELFPPQSRKAAQRLDETASRLAPVAAHGFSVTMGAGGSDRSGTVATSKRIMESTARPVTAHLISAGMTQEETLATADRLCAAGVTRILALRGDRPKGATEDTPQGFAHAAGLVAALKKRHPVDLAVAAYPEKHPEAEDLDTDIDHLKEKIDAGADQAICQFVLNPEAYGRFLDRCGAHGIDVPIIPGLMPLDGWVRVRRFALATGTSVPNWLDRMLSEACETDEVLPLVGMAATLEQARRLIAYGAPALHVYTLNRWPLPLALAECLSADRASFQHI